MGYVITAVICLILGAVGGGFLVYWKLGKYITAGKQTIAQLEQAAAQAAAAIKGK